MESEKSETLAWTTASFAFAFGISIVAEDVPDDKYQQSEYATKVQSLEQIGGDLDSVVRQAKGLDPDFDYYLYEEALIDLVIARFKETGDIEATSEDYIKAMEDATDLPLKVEYKQLGTKRWYQVTNLDTVGVSVVDH